MEVRLENLTKRWGSAIGTENITLDVKSGEFVAFLGPSGCGKTTTLLMIAGIYKPTEGLVKFDGRVVNRLQPKNRNIGMVFQSYALYPHMTVYENLAFPMKLNRTPVPEMKKRTQRVAEQLGINHLMERKPGQLSGGQQQRVALGRALTKEPSLLLFDEPLSNLDARLRISMRGEIKRLQLDLGITSIYVTHDQVEAMTMADRVAVMKGGHLLAYCPPNELYDKPSNLFVAGFIGNPPMNIIPVEVNEVNGEFHALHEGMDLLVSKEKGAKAAGRRQVILGIRPEDVSVLPADSGKGIMGEVYVVEPLGRDDLVEVSIGDVMVHALADRATNYSIGDHIQLTFDPEKMHFFDPETENSLL
ncbi:MAG: ABC transporter ATP-binding protein [Chloroflexi bacterium]|nr:MAG: ABC transporter ATP-binding protein [Chloroflexota bacterium]